MGGNIVKEKLVPLNVRIPRNLKLLMKEYIRLDAHKDLSELTRDALRSKLQNDAPQLYKKLFVAECARTGNPERACYPKPSFKRPEESSGHQGDLYQ